VIDNVLTDLSRLGRLGFATLSAARSWPKAAMARQMLEQSSLALVGEMPARFAAASAKKASNLAIDLTLSPQPDGLEHTVQNATARRPGGSLWQVCGIVAKGEVMVPGNGVHGLHPFFLL
jgi:hypothetical protein